MLRAVAVTIDSIMKPVFGTPTGTGVLPIGGIATQTPTAKISGKAGLRWCLSIRMKPRGLVRPSMPRTAATPRNAGSSIAKTLGSSWACFDRAVLGDLGHEHPVGLDLVDAGVA